jgi:FtsP/CotA-like multicopper oxidase with cupredoxin domain
MKKTRLLEMTWALGLMVLMMLLWTPSRGAAADFYLRADVFKIAAGTYSTIPQIPNEDIMMWGYSSCNSDFSDCGTGPTVPGPTLTANAGEAVTIHVRNNLTAANLLANAPAGTTVPFAEKDGTLPTSLIVPGQNLPLSPTWINQAGSPVVLTTPGLRNTGDLTSRVRSFTAETLQDGTSTYSFTARAGTYLYQSGTHPQVQVQMGLYGALIVNSVTPEVTLLYSEIDQELHYSVASGLYGTAPPAPPGKAKRGQMTSTVDYHPDFFLINGNPYTPGLTPIAAGSPGQQLRLRFLNAGLMEKTPTLQNLSMTIIAEDGNTLPHSKTQYSTLLPAGKTIDANVTLGAAGYIPVYDRALNLTNAASSPGGDLVYLQVAAASQNTLTVAKDGTGTGTITAQSLPGGIDCGLVCSQTYNTGTELKLVGTPDPGSLLTAWSEAGCTVPGDCIVTLNTDTAVTATFTKFTKIKVLAPKAGDIIPAGSTTTIWWGAPANAVKFRLRYSLNNGTTWTTIASNVIGSTYSWTVPTPASTKNKVLVRVIGFNAKGIKIGAGTSGKFTILVP